MLRCTQRPKLAVILEQLHPAALHVHTAWLVKKLWPWQLLMLLLLRASTIRNASTSKSVSALADADFDAIQHHALVKHILEKGKSTNTEKCLGLLKNRGFFYCELEPFRCRAAIQARRGFRSWGCTLPDACATSQVANQRGAHSESGVNCCAWGSTVSSRP